MALLNVGKLPYEMNVQQIENFIDRMGVRVAWEKAAMCPCVRADTTSGRPSFNCGDCYQGQVYIDRQEIIAAVMNITGQRNAQIFGDLAVGGLYMTTSGQNRIGINDRITLLDQTARFAELCELPTVKTKAPAAIGDTTLTLEHTRKFPTPKVGFVTVVVNGQTIRYTGKTVNTITGIPSLGTGAITAPIPSNSTAQLLEYPLRYSPLTVYDARNESTELKYLEDFELIDGRRVRFKTAQADPRFTILYESRPVYLVDSLSHEFRDQRHTFGLPEPMLARLPVAAVLRKDVWANRNP